MEVFPPEINKANCKKVLKDNQKKLLCKTREIFSEEIVNALDKCEKHVVLKFDKRLWFKYRLVISRELLEKFGVLEILTGIDYKVRKTISDSEQLNEHINSIKINFSISKN